MKLTIKERNIKAVRSRWDKEEKRFSDNIARIKSDPKFYLLKSRLLGFLAGDGYITKRKEKSLQAIHYAVEFFPDHYSMIPPYVEAFKYLYLKEPCVKEKTNFFSVRSSHKYACNDLLSIIPLGTHDWGVPFDFLINIESKKEWLRAFFDCEAHVSKKKITVQSVNHNGLIQVQRLLTEFGIESKIYSYVRKNPRHNTNYLLCIMKKESRKTFLTNIGFNHKLKQEKLKKVLNASVS